MSTSSDGKTFNTDISVDPSPFVQGFQKAMNSAQAGAASITSSVEKIAGSFKGMMGPLLAVSAALAGGKFFKDAIDAANKLTGESMSLAKSLGITGTEASTLRTALEDIGTDSETYIDAFQKFAKQLKTNEAGLQAMGLQTRDSNGHLRDSNTLFTEATRMVGEYKPGLDQTTAAMTLFGKGVNDVMKLQKLNNTVLEEARKKNEELGLTVTKEGVEGSKAYKRAMNDVGDVFLAIKNVIGQAVMPIFTRLAEWFADIGPSAVFVFKVAINSVATALQAIVWLTKVLWDALSALADPLFTIGRVFKKLISGDVRGATEEMQGMFTHWGGAMKGVFDKIVADSQRSWSEVKNLWGTGTAVDAPKGGTKQQGDFSKTSGGSRMAEWEEALSAKKVALERQGLLEGQYRELSKAEELKYWQSIGQIQNLSAAEKVAVNRKANDVEMAMIKEKFQVEVATLEAQAAAYKNNTEQRLRIEREIQSKYAAGTKEYEASAKRIVEIQRQAAEQERAIRESRVQAEREARLQEVTLAEQATQQALQLGIIDQAQVLQAQAQFEQRRNAIALEALTQRRQAAMTDPDRNPVEVEKINREIEQLEMQHQVRMGQIRSQTVIESSRNVTSTLSSIQSGWAALIVKLGQGTITIGGFIRGIFTTVAQSILGTLAQVAAKWAAQQIAMKLFGMATAESTVISEAGKAGAGGVASMAAAPFPMNLTAPAFGAAMAAAALAFAPAASASGGYDIPGTINPIVQAHAREMILPAKHADVIRDMADNGGAAGPSVVVNVKGVPVGDFLMVHRNELHRALTSAMRDKLRK